MCLGCGTQCCDKCACVLARGTRWVPPADGQGPWVLSLPPKIGAVWEMYPEFHANVEQFAKSMMWKDVTILAEFEKKVVDHVKKLLAEGWDKGHPEVI